VRATLRVGRDIDWGKTYYASTHLSGGWGVRVREASSNLAIWDWLTMRERPENLPDYHHPPIDEVAISVQFPIIENLVENDLREFWRDVQQQYPLAESQPRLEGPIETEEPVSRPPVLQLSVPSQGRLWLVSESDDFLVQVQNTRFIQNWRRRESEYQHFEQIHELFWQNFRKFRSFLDRKGFAQPRVEQVEVTYINWVPRSSITDFFRPASAATVKIAGSEREPQDLNWNARYLIPHERNMVQRLYVQSQPAIRTQPPHELGAQFALVFRAAQGDGLEDDVIEDVVGFARVTIVEAFTELVTQAAQSAWGRFK
jgi:uncharacterized protein (TIGR04255 family)